MRFCEGVVDRRARAILAPRHGLASRTWRCWRRALVNNHLAISIQPSRKIHTEHPEDESGREHVQLVQAAATYPPENSVEDSENDNDGNSIGGERSVHGMPRPVAIRRMVVGKATCVKVTPTGRLG